MLTTNVIVKAGAGLINVFYDIPAWSRPDKVEGVAIGSMEVDVSVDGLVFHSEEFRFCGGSPSPYRGRLVLKDLPYGEYTVCVTESLVERTAGCYDRVKAGVNRSVFTVTVTNQESEERLLSEKCCRRLVGDPYPHVG